MARLIQVRLWYGFGTALVRFLYGVRASTCSLFLLSKSPFFFGKSTVDHKESSAMSLAWYLAKYASGSFFQKQRSARLLSLPFLQNVRKSWLRQLFSNSKSCLAKAASGSFCYLAKAALLNSKSCLRQLLPNRKSCFRQLLPHSKIEKAASGSFC